MFSCMQVFLSVVLLLIYSLSFIQLLDMQTIYVFVDFTGISIIKYGNLYLYRFFHPYFQMLSKLKKTLFSH